MISDFLSVAGIQVANAARLKAYLKSIGSPLTSGSDICLCDTLTNEILGDEPYTTPSDPLEPAEWYDPDVPESAQFAGFLLLEMEGIDDFPVERTVTDAVVGGGSLGPARVKPREITVSGILLGSSCCGVEYGLNWLKMALQGCTEAKCGGDCSQLYACCPSAEMTQEEFNRRYRRTLRRVALTDGPTVTGRSGTGDCGGTGCNIGADIISVEFTLTAATPWLYGDEVELLNVDLPRDTSDDCIEWCVHDGSGTCDGEPCRNAACTATADPCADPSCVAPTPPVPTSPDICGCVALATEQECYELDLSTRPQWVDDVPMIRVYAGSSDLRQFTISMYERTQADENLTCAEIADKKRCEPFARWEVSYLKAGTELTLDGQTGRATVECNRECSTATSVYGNNGAPPTFPVISCAGFCICLESNAFLPPAADATFSFAVSGRYA